MSESTDGTLSYKTTYSRGSALGKRRSIIPDEHRFRFRAYGFPKAPMNVPREQRGQMPTQEDINQLVDQCVGVPVTTDHGAWEVVHRANGNRERVCKRAPSIVGQVTNAFIDERGRLVLDCELETSFHGMSQAQQISSGDKRDVSLGLLTDVDHTTGQTKFTLDHVALVPQGRAKGTHILQASCPAMPGLAFYGREFGMDPTRYPLTARLQQLIAQQQRNGGCTKVHVAQSQKSSHASLAKKSNGISLYSSSAEQPVVVSECPVSQQQTQSSSSDRVHCPSHSSASSTHSTREYSVVKSDVQRA